MRIVNWNIEWMNDWFVGGNQVAFRTSYSGNHGAIADVSALCGRVAGVIRQLDPDVLTVEEGPSDREEMRLFVGTYLTNSSGQALFEVFGGLDGSSQKIYALVKKTGQFVNASVATDASTQALGDSWLSDVDGDFELEDYDFTRTPLVIEGTDSANDSQVRILALHTKSKYVNRQETLWANPDTRMRFVVAALKNRRRISSEAMRVRWYLNEVVAMDANALVVVTGDFNDGPGHDYFERHYLTHNVTDILLGSSYYPELLFEHAFLTRIPESERYTAIFNDFVDNIPDKRILLDHILVSPALSGRVANSRVAHAEFDGATDEDATGRQKHASDHRPVLVEFG